MSDHADTIREALKRGGQREGYTIPIIGSTRFGPIPDPDGERKPFVEYDEQKAIDALDALAARCDALEKTAKAWQERNYEKEDEITEVWMPRVNALENALREQAEPLMDEVFRGRLLRHALSNEEVAQLVEAIYARQTAALAALAATDTTRETWTAEELDVTREKVRRHREIFGWDSPAGERQELPNPDPDLASFPGLSRKEAELERRRLAGERQET
jgi:hypothetical protein